MQKAKSLAILNAISFILHVGLAYMTQEKLLNSNTVGDISDQYFTLFTPASFTFAIWGIIYSYLGILCLFHIIMAYKHQPDNPANRDVVAMGANFMINNLATAGWLIAWTNGNILVSLILIFIQLFTLISIHQNLRIHNRFRPAASKICTELPLSIYLGWISIATIANASTYLVSIGWDGASLSAVEWTMIMIGVAAILGIYMIFGRKNIGFGLVITWGLFGIISKLESLGNDDYKNLINIAWAAMVIVGLSTLVQIFRSFTKKRPEVRFPESAPLK
jgi:hypothetical protein